jgi:hypothetical protein
MERTPTTRRTREASQQLRQRARTVLNTGIDQLFFILVSKCLNVMNFYMYTITDGGAGSEGRAVL